MNTPNDIEKLMQRLAAITTVAHVQHVSEAEQAFVASASRFKGLIAISDAFRSFVATTVGLYEGVWGPHRANPPPVRTWLVPRLAQNFHWLCGAEQQAFAGYPFPAFAQVRNIFDSAVVSSAVIQGIVSYEDAEGITPGAPVNPESVKRKRIAAERVIFSKMMGADSGLSAATLAPLEKVDRLFDWETHGQRLSATQSMEWLMGTGPLHFLPHFEENAFAPFMNRYLETMWMVHRLFPFFRPRAAPVPNEWRDRWNVIDDALETCAFALTAQFGKPVGQAVVDFVKTKFPFDATSSLDP